MSEATKPARITVVVARPREDPESIEVDNTLEALQGLVGGYLEAARPEVLVGIRERARRYLSAANYTLYVNEDGIAKRLPLNRGVYGPIVVAKCDEDGAEIGLTELEVKAVKEALAY